ncbi:hypothetical protein DRP04_10100 [Archaeoglobales archaeon]|nr:MAG: hypothetical protein DRP04_10100 [Archaeoglobales archaeon]
MNINKLVKFIEETQYLPESISFKRDWLGWKLLYCDVLFYRDGKQKELIKNIVKSVIDYRNHKIVFRASGSIFCDYVYAFVNDDFKPELPFYMLNRDEISKYYDEFIERLSIDKDRNLIVLKADDAVYEFEGYEDLIEEYGGKACKVFLDREMWRYIYLGTFDPLPLTEEVDSWRRVLKVHESVPRV